MLSRATPLVYDLREPMPRVISSRSWRVSAAAFGTPALACMLLVGLLGLAEATFRLPAVRNALKAPSVGSPSRRFELQLDGLDRFVECEGGVDCIVLGNSTALLGVDPDVLEDSYHSRTGRSLRCFNFGVGGMTASAAGAVAPILVERYQPRLLLYVVSPRDVGQSVDGPLLAQTPWVQYRLGAFNAEGWLAEHSAAFRYYLLYRQWLDPSLWTAAASAGGTDRAGFFRSQVRLSLSPVLWEHTLRAYGEVARQPPSATELAGFARVLALSGESTRIAVVEAPVHERLRRWAKRSTSFYGEATMELRRAARRQHVVFWRVPTWRIVPADGWTDFVHLGSSGAAGFSEWLGARLADSEASTGVAPGVGSRSNLRHGRVGDPLGQAGSPALPHESRG